MTGSSAADSVGKRLAAALIALMAAIQFLTVFPPLMRRPFTAREMGRGAGWYPLVGLALGATLAAADRLLEWRFPPPVRAALLLALWVALTGALHVDGFLDSCDGLLGGGSPEQRLEIMRDHSIGAFGFAGGALLFITKFAAIAGLAGWRTPALILAPILGRWSMSLALVACPYARPEGLGKQMKAYATWPRALLASLTALGLAWLAAGWQGLAAAVVALLATLAVATFTLERIPGLTGDSYGMLSELTELAVLLVFILF